jgi:hypothetical protein
MLKQSQAAKPSNTDFIASRLFSETVLMEPMITAGPRNTSEAVRKPLFSGCGRLAESGIRLLPAEA